MVDESLIELHKILERMIGLHRQMLETVRMERNSIAAADVSGIQEAALAKEGIIAAIRQQESERLKTIAVMALKSRRKISDLTMNVLVLETQEVDAGFSEQLRSTFAALVMLIDRVLEQNDHNKAVVEKSLEHVRNMKANILRESVPRSGTYSSSGQKVGGRHGEARMFSQEI
ncbi:MAG: hypothetical protein A2583_02645 [Bdellovibrionales bacterium RIFOXYD1_FULL_53_11]|nr:MAG: hypothetical protein A2583_02645 [Bdellovibrionales bacterium RIFOXYD1_FULL_53_11]